MVDMSLRGRPFNFPDPRNVTVGNPSYLATPDLVINLYNQNNSPAVTNYCQRARDWFVNTALSIGWTHAAETGNGLGILLHLQISVNSLPGTGGTGQLPSL